MANVADHRDMGEGAALAALLDPLALEARLADARARRAVALAARESRPAAEILAAPAPRFRVGMPALLMTGIAFAAAAGLIAPLVRSTPVAPEVVLAAALLLPPAESIPPLPAGTAGGWLAAAQLAPELAAPRSDPPEVAPPPVDPPVLAAAVPAQLRPEPRPPHRTVAASRVRAGGVPFAEAAPVLARAATAVVRDMVGRSAEGGPLAYPLTAVPRVAAAPPAVGASPAGTPTPAASAPPSAASPPPVTISPPRAISLPRAGNPPRAVSPPPLAPAPRAVRQARDTVRQISTPARSAVKAGRPSGIGETVRGVASALGRAARPATARSADRPTRQGLAKNVSSDRGTGSAKGKSNAKSASADRGGKSGSKGQGGSKGKSESKGKGGSKDHGGKDGSKGRGGGKSGKH